MIIILFYWSKNWKYKTAIRESLGKNVKYINSNLNSSSILRALEFLEFFDVVLIDALDSLEMFRFDIFTVYPYIKRGGYILLDDSNYFEVKFAIKDSINILNLIDCDLISAHGEILKYQERNPNNRWPNEQIKWDGLYMLRKPLKKEKDDLSTNYFISENTFEFPKKFP